VTDRLVLVAACALVDPDGRVLLTERPAGKTMAGLWEFPGGKIEAGERPEQTLIRELKEELGIDKGAGGDKNKFDAHWPNPEPMQCVVKAGSIQSNRLTTPQAWLMGIYRPSRRIMNGSRR
jgi:mutator protein MutT